MATLCLTINNPFFNPSSKFSFSSGKPYVIYGKNGSGKSTIARAFLRLKTDCSENDLSVTVTDEKDSPVVLEEEKKKRIFVFNEDFVNENVRLKTDGLKPIVILGKAVGIEDQIEALRKRIKDLQEEDNNLKLNRFEEKGNEDNLDSAKKSIITKLKDDGGYADRGRKILDQKYKISVSETIIDELNCQEVLSITNEQQLRSSLSDLLDILDKTRGKTEPLTFDEPKLIGFEQKDVEQLLAFFEDSHLKDELRAKFESVSSRYGAKLWSLARGDAVADRYCPLCLRDFDDSSHQDYVDIIDSVFDERVKTLLSQIDALLSQIDEIRLISLDDQINRVLRPEVVNDFNASAGAYNHCLNECRALLLQKKENPKMAINESVNSLDSVKSAFIKAHVALRKEITSYNEAIHKFKENQNKAIEYNKKLACFEVKPLLDRYNHLLEARTKARLAHEKLQSEIEKVQSEIRNLNSQRRNFSIAAEEINRNLAQIYLSNKRLRLENSEEGSSSYTVHCRGKRAKPAALSTGERNAIALCYFYETIKEERDAADAFSEDFIVVIDDPISSLDFETQSGIMAFLRRILKELSAMNKSIIVVLTHDLEVLQYFSGVTRDLRVKFEILTLNREMKDLSPRSFSNYGFLLRELFEFAESNNPDEENETIYNRTRKVLEGFSSFVYRCGISDLFTEKVWNGVQDSAAKAFFVSTCADQKLNRESHLEQWAKRFPDSAEAMFDGEAAQSIVREALVLLYCLYPQHVIRNISGYSIHTDNPQLNENDVENKLRIWKKDLIEADE